MLKSVFSLYQPALLCNHTDCLPVPPSALICSEISTDLACNQTSCNEFIVRNGFRSFWDPDLIVLLGAHGASFPVLCDCSLSDCMTPVWSWVKALANCATSASFISDCTLCKGIVHPQTKSLSSCIHHHVVPNFTFLWFFWTILDFHYIKKKQKKHWDILLNVFLCVLENKESHTGLEQKKDSALQ